MFAGLTVPAWAQDAKPTSKPTAKPSPIEKAIQKYKEAEAKNGEEMAAEMQELQKSAQIVGEKVKKALTPLAKRVKKGAEAQAPAIIEAVSEQNSANSKLVRGIFSALKNVANEVAEEVSK